MTRRYPDEDVDDYADRAHEESVQRELDERALEDAYLEGQRVGLQGGGAGLNPWADVYSAEYQRWEAGRAAGEASRLSRRAA